MINVWSQYDIRKYHRLQSDLTERFIKNLLPIIAIKTVPVCRHIVYETRGETNVSLNGAYFVGLIKPYHNSTI